ncbi:MAG: phosphoribosylaminoimidazolesuccinocarboxamide synthase [Nanoarchaeota archaeon]|nr:phosphoribosylaminoimidazolesuccinocarboxamide synthase [Nanoarchaeota archaeon]
MTLENKALAKTDDFPIKHEGNIHNGKVRSVYWLTDNDSDRLIQQKAYDIPLETKLGVMIISDRISAFDCIWQGEEDLEGIPGKGASLNAISNYWFSQFNIKGLAGNHIIDTPHPLVWIVKKAQPIMVEAIARDYITGSMWRDYEKGIRKFGGITFPDGLKANQKLSELLITPSTKGIMKGILGIPEEEDVNITREQIEANHEAFGFRHIEDVDRYEHLLLEGFDLIREELRKIDELFVDTKFEFGYANDREGRIEMIYIDEIGTPDSSRMWNAQSYERGKIIENSKEGFRQYLLNTLERDVFINKGRMEERKQLAINYRVPVDEMMKVSKTYMDIAEKITGKPIKLSERPREEILDSLASLGILN